MDAAVLEDAAVVDVDGSTSVCTMDRHHLCARLPRHAPWLHPRTPAGAATTGAPRHAAPEMAVRGYLSMF